MAISHKLELAITLTVGMGGGYLLNNYAENLQKEKVIEYRTPASYLIFRRELPRAYIYRNPLYFMH